MWSMGVNAPFQKAIYVICGALLLMTAAFINAFPLVYSDTSTYISSGFELQTPFDRPITYGLFLWFFSFGGFSLWTVILAQSLLLSNLVFLLFERALVKRNIIGISFLSAMLLISLGSSASWTSSQLMSDIFTAIAALSLLILIQREPKVGSKSYGLYFLFFLSVSMHMSHIGIFVLLILVLYLLRTIDLFSAKKHWHAQPLFICLVLSFASMLSMGPAPAKSKHAFLMGALVEHGIAKAYLDEYCGEKNYAFCAYKDELPDKAWIFLWDKESPFYSMGSWKGTKEEFNEIIFSTLTEPKFIGMHIQASFKAWIEQLRLFKMGDGNGVFLEGRLFERIQKNLPREINDYSLSRQNQADIAFVDTWNKVQMQVVFISLLLIALGFWKRKHLREPLLLSLVFILFTVLINAWACGTLANAIDRLGSKMIFLLPLMAALIVSSFFGIRREEHSDGSVKKT